MAEIAGAASECEVSRLHQWPEAGLMEIDPETSDGDGSGDLICTGLINHDMPLIRYRVGDIAKLSDSECGCGRRLPLLDQIEGRRDDVLLTKDGRRIGRMDPVFKSSLPIIEAQIVQRTYSSVIVRYVPDEGFDRNTKIELADRICERMGDIHVGFEEVNAIARTDRGKFKAVVCEIPPEKRNDHSSRSPITV
jgi:phenylacetate-CoA ligase